MTGFISVLIALTLMFTLIALVIGILVGKITLDYGVLVALILLILGLFKVLGIKPENPLNSTLQKIAQEKIDNDSN